MPKKPGSARKPALRDRAVADGKAVRAHRYLHLGLLLGLGLWAAGYWGPWVPHKDAGLIILGIDFGEFVKFLPQVRAGKIHLWREGFYLPALTLSLTLSLTAWRKEFPWPKAVRVLANLLAIPPALAMLPPIWTPSLMLHSHEFRQQSIAIAIALAAAALSPILGRLPAKAIGVFLIALLAISAAVPLWEFSRIRGAIAGIYAEKLGLGWGTVVMPLGGALAAIALAGALLLPVDERHDPAP